MPKTTTNKKARKPTQLDRIENKLCALDAFTTSMLASTSDRLCALESRLPAPQEQEPEKWVPQDDDLVALKSNGTVYRITSVERSSGNTYYSLGYKGAAGKWIAESLRPATPQEIAAHKEAEVERKRKEQEAAELAKPIEFGAMCLVHKHQHEVYLRFENGEYILVDEHGDECGYERSEFTILTP